MVSSPARPTARARTPIAEKYINMRTQAFTRTHAQAMQEYIDGGGTEERYWETFNARLRSSEAKWKRDVEAIDGDPNATFREKREQKNRLNRMYPAWTQEQEERFILQYGDPREVDRSALEGLLRDLQDSNWENAMRGGQIVSVAKHPWERKFYEALVSPRDGSVPLMLDAKAAPAPSVILGASTRPQLSEDPEIQRMAEEYARNICPHCKTHFERLNANHTNACKSNPANAVSVEA